MISVSAVVVTKNRELFLQKAIASIEEQSYPVSEIIIVDDGSTDNTEEWCKNYSSTSSLVYLRNEKSCGGAQARNIGIETARSEYVAFLDDDDTWHKDKIADQVQAVNEQENSPELIYTGSLVTLPDGTVVKKTFHSSSLFPKIKIGLLNFVGITSTVMVKRELLLKEKFTSGLPALQDYELFVRLIRKGIRVHGIQKPLVNYYSDPNVSGVSDSLSAFIKGSFYIIGHHSCFVYLLPHLIGFFRIFLHKLFTSPSFRKELKQTIFRKRR